MEDILNIIEKRSSVRQFEQNRVIPKECIRKILEAGRLAPSWINAQPWHFIVVEREQNKELLSNLALNQKHVKTASCVIVCLLDLNAWDKTSYEKMLRENGVSEEKIENIFSNSVLYPKLLGYDTVILRTTEQCVYAQSYMTLEASSLGIDSCIVGAVANELTKANSEISELVKRHFKIPEGNYILSLLCLGYRDKNFIELKVKKRKGFDKIVSKEIYNEKF